jgi:hypothetical protein
LSINSIQQPPSQQYEPVRIDPDQEADPDSLAETRYTARMSNTVARALHVTAALWLLSSSLASAQQIQVTMAEGRVTVIAKDATPRQILAEWARVGHVTIVNLERVSGGTMTLELKDMPESDVFAVLMRSVDGYIATLRSALDGNLSRFDRVVVMATSGARAQATESQTRVSSSGATSAVSMPSPGVGAPDVVSPAAIVPAIVPNEPPTSSPIVGVTSTQSPSPQGNAPAFASGGTSIGGSVSATATPGAIAPPPPGTTGLSPSEESREPVKGSAAPGMPVPRTPGTSTPLRPPQ